MRSTTTSKTTTTSTTDTDGPTRNGGWASRRLAVVLWVMLLCWAVGILYLSSLGPDELPDAAFVLWDKINHFLAFALGGWLAARAVRASRPGTAPRRAVLVAVLLIAVFGVLDETLQTFTPGRTGASASDWAADVLGASAGALLSLRRARRN